MSLSIQQSFVEQFSFNGKNVRAVYIQDVGECLVACDVYKAMGYGRKAGVKVIQRLVPEKYRMRLGDVDAVLKGVDKSVHPQPDTVLMKELGLYCFLLRCKKVEAEPFMDWVVETVLPREVRKLAGIIEEKESEISLLNNDNTVLKNEIQDLIANRHVPRCGDFDNVLCFIAKNSNELHPYYVIRCQYKCLEKHKKWLRRRYPEMEVIDKCDDTNAIHRWCEFKREVIKKPNFYKNHFSLTDEKKELMQTLLDVTI